MHASSKPKAIKKWKVLDSDLVLNEKWYRVRRDTVEIEPGKIIDDYYLGLFNDVALVVALTANQHLPLVRQYKHGAGEILLELPAGYIDGGEQPLAAAKRELREETGFTAPTWQKLGTFYKNSAKARGDNVHLFLALNAEKTTDQQLDENENIEIVVTPFAKAVAMAGWGQIEGSDSALGLLLAERAVPRFSSKGSNV